MSAYRYTIGRNVNYFSISLNTLLFFSSIDLRCASKIFSNLGHTIILTLLKYY